MNNLRRFTTMFAATVLLLLVGLGKPIADYYQMSRQAHQLAQVRQQLSGPIQIHQAVRGLGTARLSNPDELAIWLDQYNQGIWQSKDSLHSETLTTLQESSTTIASRIPLVAKVMAYDISLDIFDPSLDSATQQARINATTEAITNLQHQLASLDASPSSATKSLIASSKVFIHNLNSSPLPSEPSLVSDLEQLQDNSLSFILEPLRLPQSISAMTKLNQFIETLREKEQLILGNLTGDVGNP